jgi:hypothetical protein
VSESKLHPRRKLVMRARADISAAIVVAIRTCDLTQAELLMILAQEMMACAGVMVAEERTPAAALLTELALEDFSPAKGGPYEPHAFEPPITLDQPHSYEPVAGNSYCGWCGGGKLHPIHAEAENR